MGTLYKNGIPYGGGGGGDNSKTITYEDYKNLPEAEKKNGTTYYVPDYPEIDGTNIVDNLESTDTDKALSANMGRELNDNFKDIIIIETSLKTVSFTANARVNITFTPPTIDGYKAVALLDVYTTTSNTFTSHFVMNSTYTAHCSNSRSEELTIGGIFLMVRDL